MFLHPKGSIGGRQTDSEAVVQTDEDRQLAFQPIQDANQGFLKLESTLPGAQDKIELSRSTLLCYNFPE